MALSAVLFALVGASAASAAPKGNFAVFGDCPTTSAESCLYAKTESGKIVIGKEDVPIEKAIVLQGGLNENAEHTFNFVAATDGNTLSRSPQKVPGGLSGLVKCDEISNFMERASCELFFENGATGVTATTELAAPASSIKVNLVGLLEGTGTALSLPVKVKLENPLLGNSCYVGSNSNPIVLELTTGKSGAFTGEIGEFQFVEEAIALITHNSLVNGTFSAPAASGCGGVFSFLVDPIIDSRLGLPSASGKNAAVLNGTLEAGASL
ncbi:MAG: hypothetical protein ACLQBB_12640 [Solirubrobacteraceae bacterium]